MFEISLSPVTAVIVTQALMSVPAFVMKIFEPSIDPLAVAQLGLRARRAGVGARVRLGQPERREPLARGELRQPLALLLLVAEQVDRHRPERRVRGDGDRDRRVDPRQLLDGDRVRDGVAAGAAVLLRDRQAHEAELGELRDELVGEARLAVELLGDRRHARLGEVADGAPDELLLVGQLEVHESESAQLGDEPNAVAGAAGHVEVVAAAPLEEARAGHVDVRPRAVAGELLEELRGEHRRALAQGRAVLHVRERRVDVAAVARVEREQPRVVAAARAGLEDLGRASRRRSRRRRRRSRQARAPSRQ